ncbi:MAG TPA: SusC/RagA family TonB-linked outer membrane protein, partial [Porphyromonadaceae bacterium]|nr:SusC/RagA family TonB-linked outer membrane protein [Porphyromonadaceae bacterium]
KELKGPTSNLTTMLSGRVAGLISYQTSGEPGRDNATFFIRGVGSFGAGKVDPLILINGIESTTTELARIQPDDIEGFSVLKDATATSMYGTRGANGVILLSTKNGHSGKTKFNIRYESSISSNAKGYNLADNVTYMELANEASLTRGGERVYDFNKIEKTRVKANEYLYPNNNWKEIMIRDYTLNHRMNMNVSGGGDIAKYYLSASYRFDNGMLKTHKTNNFDTNIKNTSLEIRSNIDLNLTKTTIASVRINGLFDDLSGPATSSGVYTGSDVFKSMLKASPVAFPAVFPQNMQPWVKHPLFGNASMSGKNESNTIDLYYNPYANA